MNKGQELSLSSSILTPFDLTEIFWHEFCLIGALQAFLCKGLGVGEFLYFTLWGSTQGINVDPGGCSTGFCSVLANPQLSG